MASVRATIQLLKGTTKFKGIEAGFDTFVDPSAASCSYSHVPTPPNVSFASISEDDDLQTVDTSQIRPQLGSNNPLVLLSQAVIDEHKTETGVKERASAINKSPSVAPSSKRKHYDTNASIQLRVLQREEELQRKKENLLDIELRQAKIEEEVALLKKKLEMEISRMTAVDTNQVVPQQQTNISEGQLQEILDSLMSLSQQQQQSSQHSEQY